MINIVAGLETFGNLIGDLSGGGALFFTSGRSIGTFFPHVVIEETHRDEMVITEHPVEIGAPITDHAFMRPVSVEMRCGWSDSTAGAEGFIKAVYQGLLALQSSAKPFDVVTGKRSYTNMLIKSLLVKTDVESENVLNVVALLQNVIITSTETAPSSTSPNSNGSSAIGNWNVDGSFTPQGGAADAPPGAITPGLSTISDVTSPNGPSFGGLAAPVPSPSGPPLTSIIGHQ